MRGSPEAKIYAPHVAGKLAAISFITVGELYFGAEKACWGARKRQQLETILRNFVVIPYDYKVARCYGRLMAEGCRTGKCIAPNDAWIAACSLRHDLALITHNAKHFMNISGLNLVTARSSTDIQKNKS
jgi:predicted nucleic acid-binding protein